MDPIVAVSWGELFDRISILEIKQARMTSEAARTTAAAQLAILRQTENMLSQEPMTLPELRKRLKSVNETLWSIEDELRDREARKAFDARFIELARGVYRNNDERSRIKHAIDRLLGSESEPKEYTPYDVQSGKPDGAG